MSPAPAVTDVARGAKARVGREEVDALLAIGLRNKWYPLCPSHFVTEKPLALKRAGERLVLWRDAQGAVQILEDRCPHRGVPLSCGHALGDRLACAYHGVEVTGDGIVAAVPGEPSSNLVGKKAVRRFPAQELNGAVFAYIGDAKHPDPVAFTPPEQLTSDAFGTFLCYGEWRIPYRYMYDNNMDPMHGTFLHKQSHSMSVGRQEAKFGVTDTPTGFRFEKLDQKDVNFDWSEYGDTGAQWCRLEIPYPKTGGPGGNFGIIFMATPIDEATCACFFWRFRKVQGWQRDVWRFLYRNRLEARHWHVLEQDRSLMEATAPDADRRENLYQHDMGLVRLRRQWRQEARAQLEFLRDG